MSTILYARSVLSPKSMLVWLMMMELPRSGVALPEDESLLARLCMTTPRGLAKARSEIAAAGLDGAEQSVPSDHGCKTPSTTPDAVRMREARMRRKNANGTNEHPNAVPNIPNERTNKTANDPNDVPNATPNKANEHPNDPNERGVPSCAPVHDARICAGAEIDNQNKIILGLYTESESDNSYTVETPNQILGDFLQKPPCVTNSVSSSLAEPIPLDPEIIPPDLSDIRGAVAGMLAGVTVPMSETTPKSEITEVANAENSSRSATPIPPCRTGTGPVKPRRAPGISQHLQSEFARFWDVCPRKVGKGAALKAYAAARQLEDEPTLLEAMKSYARSRAGEDQQYTCHPATWLNQGRWDDEIPPDAGSSPTSGPFPRGGDAGHSVMRPGRRVSSDPVGAAFAEQMAEIEARERESQHVH